MSDQTPTTTTTGAVRASEDTILVQFWERTNGPSMGLLKMEGKFPTDSVPYLKQLKQYMTRGSRGLNLTVDGNRIDILTVRTSSGAATAAEEQPLFDDEETKVLAVQKEELRKDIARLRSEGEILTREHARQRTLLTNDIERLTQQVIAEESRLKEARVRTNAALDAMKQEIETKMLVQANQQASLENIAELEKTLTKSFREKIENLNDELVGRINKQTETDKKVDEVVKELAGKEPKQKLGEKILSYVEEAAPAKAISSLLNLGVLRIAKRAGIDLADLAGE